ncbi:MAG: hypothetical protein ACREQM_06225 [Candidatus Dormibacteraceae bacterium]
MGVWPLGVPGGPPLTETYHQNSPPAQTGGSQGCLAGLAAITHCELDRHVTIGADVLGDDRKFTHPEPVFIWMVAGVLVGRSGSCVEAQV